ncbi:DNA-binding transcriptional MerR regulator [Granulicella aggregans]|uniref:DNA-binding transcriptional MerR regulator n=1 Tax=Granulicella aggregans TaxID=474949 RepID=A0A7W8E2Z9_9BACT|nr:DNA-binding transcriptional MerR regulator [Granulicella aggregans]
MSQSSQELITEIELAERLGVSTRQVRNYLKNDSLPHIGDGRGRRFEWLKVLEWYLLYRVAISGTGGNQRDVLAEKLAEIRNSAASRAEALAADTHRRILQRETAGLKLQMEELRRVRGVGSRRLRPRGR